MAIPRGPPSRNSATAEASATIIAEFKDEAVRQVVQRGWMVKEVAQRLRASDG